MKLELNGTVDRTGENWQPDPCISVTLDNGFEVHFFETGLTDEEYINRENIIQRLESKEAGL